MKNIAKIMKHLFILLVLSCMLASACTSISDSRFDNKMVHVSFVGELDDFYTGDEVTKATLLKTVRTVWKVGDPVLVFGGKEYLGYLTVSSIAESGNVAKVSGNIKVPENTVSTISCIYASTMDPSKYTVGDMYDQFVLSIENHSIASFPFLTYASLPYDGTVTGKTIDIPEQRMSFYYASSVYTVYCYNLQPSLAVQCATLNNSATECILNLSNTGDYISVGQSSNIGTLVWTPKSGAKVSSQGELQIQLAVAKTPSQSSTRTITVYEDGYIGTDTTFDRLDFQVSKAYNTMCGFSMQPAYGGGIDPYDHTDWTW